ncbi:HD-GYP domain-containing protein [Gracilibacillus alcaliphilus]|uniref:HD-GYP domain-containing protein n=1 Tax=Gracilibacillus alcaliphilus TaxID=1401441 RepID=UPI00195B8C13|nr:HD-GYP domain-containing protein [Gracilibacillus alcaliphilus]MBM7675535.1 putative nucleotidyltransferase with HDIG domain [Gracilibacillus alcaliphilus]
MHSSNQTISLLGVEKRATIWFLWLFYIIYYCYELIYYFMMPIVSWDNASQISKSFVDYLVYVILLAILPAAIYLLRKNNPSPIKYIYFFTFIILTFIQELSFFILNHEPYSHGSIIELIFILFSPIFVNKRFFYVVFLGLTGKYLIVGIVFQDPVFILPLFLVLVLSCVAFIVLSRFIHYVSAFQSAYNQQIENIVKGITATLELKDMYTKGHSERVANYSLILLKSYKQYKSRDVRLFYYACLLHDIGKISISEQILSKESKLSVEEYEVMKTHPVVGAEALKNVEGINEYLDVVRHHHERWDGAGYPDQLKGAEITIFARIVAIADAFDAMTSSRSYRQALSPDEAYDRIIKGSGTQFDPQVVYQFKEVYPLWINYYKQYNKAGHV